MSNPTSRRWVDVLFSRLAVRYGDAWARKWEGLPIEAVKADWERGLSHIFARNPKAIAYALDHLPEYPPTVDVFARQCLAARPAAPALDLAGTKPDPNFAASVLARMQKPSNADPRRECMERLQARRERQGGRLEPAQRAMLESLERRLCVEVQA